MERYSFTAERRAALEGLRQPFAVYQFLDRRVVTLLLSDGFCRLFGYDDRADAVYDMDNNMYKDAHPDDVARIADAAVRFATEGGSYDVIYRTRKKDGGYTVVHAMGEHVYTEDGTKLAQVWYTDEGTYTEDPSRTGSELTRTLSTALHEESIVKASRYDYLTGLPSMSYFFELAEAAKRDILRGGGQPVLLYIDLHGMKFFNTKHSFAEGDRLLRDFAAILAGAFGSESCCRIGADHFAVVTEEAGLEEKLEGVFLAFRNSRDGKTPPIHVGVYPNSVEDVPVSSACDRAMLACGTIKASYTSGISYYRAELREDIVMKQYIIENLDAALREKRVRVYLQPIIRAVNERICDVEALARWDDPEKGLLSPAAFIPTLEDAGLIYKLDLYMLDQVLEAIKLQIADGFSVVPHSINLSRSDFDQCDMVEEFRRRVDAAGIPRDRITVEITESVLGSDFGFMKKQVERFRELGFPVWLDDFGSGYASMDVLQSMRFDLIKFDMSFMRKLDEGDEAKVVLTELMRLATSLGVDTVCEGVETEAQVRFLQEIGCSKLQGYYYSEPVSFDSIRERFRSGTLIETENSEESEYYESIGRVNLFDLGVIAGGEENALQNTFDTIPIAVLEILDDRAGYIRSNRSYQAFVRRFFDAEILSGQVDFGQSPVGYGESFLAVMRQCCVNGSPAFFDERMPDGSVVHSYARRIGVNPVTGSTAVAIAVLSVTEPDDSTSYADIARALAADYYKIFTVDLDTDRYVEYSSEVGGEKLLIERHGEEFFASARSDAAFIVYEEDRELFLKWFNRENILRELDTQGVFTTTFRQMDTGVPVYANIKITRMQGGRRIIIGVSIIDAQMKQQEEEKRLRQERVSLGRIAALSPNYIVLYTVDPATGHYTQYNSSREFESFGLAVQGEDFFADVIRDAPKVIDPRDMERHLRVFTKKNIMREIEKNGLFLHNYRILMDGSSVPVSLRATLAREDDGEKLLLGVAYDDREEYRRRLEDAFEQERDTSTVYTRIALSLARGCTDLYYVNMDTDAFIEFHTDDERGVLTAARRGTDFFEGCERDVKLFVHPEDQAAFVEAMNRAYLRKALSRTNVFELVYRRIKGGDPFYVRMKVSRIEEDDRFIVIAVSDIDEEMRQRSAEKRMKEERLVYARLHSITGNFVCVYVVDPETGSYREFSATAGYEESFSQEKEGTDFFTVLREAVRTYSYPEDTDRVLSRLTEENVMAEIARTGIFTLSYRILTEGKPVHYQLKAAMVEEEEGPRLIVGLNDIDSQVRQEQEYERRIAQAQSQASIDALTQIRNRHAYLETEAQMDRRIAEHLQPPFAIVMLDVNDLKKINDTAGHHAGDQYLRDACRIVCDIFKHSPVFRVGGDEFAVIAQGSDYDCVGERLAAVRGHNAEASRGKGIMIACGMAKFEGDDCVAAVFDRADQNMYEDKKALKDAGGAV